MLSAGMQAITLAGRATRCIVESEQPSEESLALNVAVKKNDKKNALGVFVGVYIECDNAKRLFISDIIE